MVDKDKLLNWLKWLYEQKHDFSAYRQEIERSIISQIFSEIENGSFDYEAK